MQDYESTERSSEVTEGPLNFVMSRRRLTGGFGAVLGATTLSALLGACGGDDDEDEPAAIATEAASGQPEATSDETTQDEATPTEADSSSEGPEPTSASSEPTETESASPDATAGSSAGVPTQGGTAILITAADPPTMNMAVTTGIADAQAATKVQEALVRMTVDYDFEPHLAEAWEISDDGKTYTFTLRQGITWQDGEPFTSEDVKFTMLEVAGKYQPIASGVFEIITSIETPDEHTAIINLESPFGAFLIALTVSRCPMVPEHIFEGTDILNNPATLAEPVGTGPFILKEWNRGESLTFERNPNYWQPGKPYLDRVILRVMGQPESRTAALQAGEADYMFYSFLDNADFETIKEDNSLQYRTNGGFPEMTMMFLNDRSEPLSDKRVRQALFTALDREFILETVNFNVGQVSKSSITPLLNWPYNPDVDLTQMYAYDPDRASQMLDEAGYKMNGNSRFSLRFVSNVSGGDRMGQIVREQWGAIGVDVALEPLENQAWAEKVYVNWDFDATTVSYTTSGDPQLGIARMYVSSSIVKQPYTNPTGWSTPEVDDLFAQGSAQATNDARAPFYFQIQEILADELPAFPIFDSQGIDVASTKLDTSQLWRYPLYAGWDAAWIEE